MSLRQSKAQVNSESRTLAAQYIVREKTRESGGLKINEGRYLIQAWHLEVEMKKHISSTEINFWNKVRKTKTCWIWTASKRNKGYGAFVYKKNNKIINGRAHRYSYELIKGEIPNGLFVLHSCDNPSCVNPDHLFLGTNYDNVQDMIKKGRRVNGGTYNRENYERGENHHNAKLSEKDVRNIRKMYLIHNQSYSKIAKIFSIGTTTAYKIIKRITWYHLN